ncbi:aldehyde dehydrogenase family protein [Micromonospora sp. NPDC048930]|uniref:aldehyde dehydrogenase family protein n=1 Tax=Micromonospora sp. NPDC048930 TaxID=3364261 RepID=UPI00371BA78E
MAPTVSRPPPAIRPNSFSNEQEALAIANSTEYGPAAYVFTSDMRRGLRITRREHRPFDSNADSNRSSRGQPGSYRVRRAARGRMTGRTRRRLGRAARCRCRSAAVTPMPGDWRGERGSPVGRRRTTDR